jgi:hypothetical protein
VLLRGLQLPTQTSLMILHLILKPWLRRWPFLRVYKNRPLHYVARLAQLRTPSFLRAADVCQIQCQLMQFRKQYVSVNRCYINAHGNFRSCSALHTPPYAVCVLLQLDYALPSLHSTRTLSHMPVSMVAIKYGF